jgi:hypothetical protein
MDTETTPPFRPAADAFRWDGVTCMPYKQDGTAPFKDVSRQVLFHEPDLSCELRYFEVGPGGHSTLERHAHAHAVMILRGSGQCMVGTEVRAVRPFDLVSVPSMQWHQFRATDGRPLGFLCMVNVLRDRPALPGEADLEAMRTHPAVAAFLAG